MKFPKPHLQTEFVDCVCAKSYFRVTFILPARQIQSVHFERYVALKRWNCVPCHITALHIEGSKVLLIKQVIFFASPPLQILVGGCCRYGLANEICACDFYARVVLSECGLLRLPRPFTYDVVWRRMTPLTPSTFLVIIQPESNTEAHSHLRKIRVVLRARPELLCFAGNEPR